MMKQNANSAAGQQPASRNLFGRIFTQEESSLAVFLDIFTVFTILKSSKAELILTQTFQRPKKFTSCFVQVSHLLTE